MIEKLIVTLRDDNKIDHIKNWSSVKRNELLYIYFWINGGARGGKIIKIK